MKTPKMLPWLANTAGIELERAEHLWHLAAASAEKITGESESARCLSIAREQMVSLVEKELLASNPVEDTPWLMIQAHVSVAPMIIADLFAQATATTRQFLNRTSAKNKAVA
jgi:hypothetical protein